MAAAAVALYKARPERGVLIADQTGRIVGYQGEVIDDLHAEIERRRKVEANLRAEIADLRAQVRDLSDELAASVHRLDPRPSQGEPPQAGVG